MTDTVKFVVKGYSEKPSQRVPGTFMVGYLDQQQNWHNTFTKTPVKAKAGDTIEAETGVSKTGKPYITNIKVTKGNGHAAAAIKSPTSGGSYSNIGATQGAAIKAAIDILSQNLDENKVFTLAKTIALRSLQMQKELELGKHEITSTTTKPITSKSTEEDSINLDGNEKDDEYYLSLLDGIENAD